MSLSSDFAIRLDAQLATFTSDEARRVFLQSQARTWRTRYLNFCHRVRLIPATCSPRQQISFSLSARSIRGSDGCPVATSKLARKLNRSNSRWGRQMAQPANDNTPILLPSIDHAIPGQALRLSQPHRKFGCCYAEFVRHTGDGKHVVVRKLISSHWRARWTNPIRVERALVTKVHTIMARPEMAVAS